MAKKETKKDVYYFSHDYNPTSDPKMLAFVGEYGAVGYGIYWRIVEMLHESQEHTLPLKNYIYSALAKQMLTSVEQVFKIVESCINDFELFDSNDDVFWCNRVLRNVEKRIELIAKKVKAGEASAKKRKEKKEAEENLTRVKHNSTDVQHNSTEPNKGNKIKLNETKENNVNKENSGKNKKINLPYKFSDIIEELKKSDNFKIECERVLKINVNKFDDYLDNFAFHNKPADEETIFDFDKVRSHFSYWLKLNKDKLPQINEQRPKIKIL